MKKSILSITVIIAITFFLIKSRNSFYADVSPNNQVSIIDFQDTKYKTDVLSRYIDTFLSRHNDYDARKHGYTIDSSLDFLSLRQIYFSSYPIEIYTIRDNYFISIRTAYDISTGQTLAFHAKDFQSEEESNYIELQRIKNRFQKEVLDTVIKYINLSDISDSLKYKQDNR